jgi:hypothetical protein
MGDRNAFCEERISEEGFREFFEIETYGVDLYNRIFGENVFWDIERRWED